MAARSSKVAEYFFSEKVRSSEILLFHLKKYIFTWITKWYQKAICVSICTSNRKKKSDWLCCCASSASLFLTDGLLLCLHLLQQGFVTLEVFSLFVCSFAWSCSAPFVF